MARADRRPDDLLADEPCHRRGLGAVLVAGVGAALGVAVAGLPREDAPLPAVARYAMVVALPIWHTTEPVSEVVYGTRGFDTFGETFLLLAAIVGITTICRRKEPRRGFIGEELAGGREQSEIAGAAGSDDGGAEERQAEATELGLGGGGGKETPDDEPVGATTRETAAAMTVVVRGAVRMVAPILAIAGLYLVAWGYSPGGGFPAGAVVLGVILFVYVAYGYHRVERVIRPDVIETLEVAGAVAIIAIELFGLFLKGSFSANFLPVGPVGTIRSGGILQAFSVSEFVEVGTGLVLAVFGLLGMGHDWSQHQADAAPQPEDPSPFSPDREGPT
jgi:multicomponent Na+:H+ antiporter subunit B